MMMRTYLPVLFLVCLFLFLQVGLIFGLLVVQFGLFGLCAVNG
jgi:hypothetical protein